MNKFGKLLGPINRKYNHEQSCFITTEANPKKQTTGYILIRKCRGLRMLPKIHTCIPLTHADLEIRYYEDLGAVEDMPSNLIVEAYRRQVETDPKRVPYYLRCLKCVGGWRRDTDGKSIEHAISLEYASGRYADDDIPNAYKYFELDYDDPTLSDDTIVASFFSRLNDSPHDMEPRRQLWRIGDSRGSEKLKSAAEESMYRPWRLPSHDSSVINIALQECQILNRLWCTWVLRRKPAMILLFLCIQQRYETICSFLIENFFGGFSFCPVHIGLLW